MTQLSVPNEKPSSQAEKLYAQVSSVPGLSEFLDPMRYTFTSFYPPWYTLPQSGVSQFPQDDSQADPSFALYVHIPYCEHPCPECHYCKIPVLNPSSYLELIHRQLTDVYSKENGINGQAAKAVYIGGGTPSSLKSQEIKNLLSILSNWTGGLNREPSNQNSSIELTFECHPRSLLDEGAKDKLEALQQECGHNLRLSIGIQSLQPGLLRRIRGGGSPLLYDEQDVRRMLKSLPKELNRLNLDFMFGFATSSKKETIDAELDRVQRLIQNSEKKPSSLTFYQLWHGTDRIPDLSAKKFQSFSERITAFECFVNPILSSRIKIRDRLLSLDYVSEVASIWRHKDVEGVECAYHVDFLYGNRNLLPVGLSSYGYWNGLAFISPKGMQDFEYAINKGIIPVELAAFLSVEQQMFRRALLSMKRYQSPISIDDIKGYLGQDYSCKALKALKKKNLINFIASNSFVLTEDGFIIVEEIISWFLTAPPMHRSMIIGKARIVDRLARNALTKATELSRHNHRSDSYEGSLEDCLTATNEHLDEVVRRCWPGSLDGESRYANCICAVQSHKTHTPLFSKDYWYAPKDRKRFQLLENSACLSKMERYGIARNFFNEAGKHNFEPVVSVFKMFFSSPRWFEKKHDINGLTSPDKASEIRMPFYSEPPYLLCRINADGSFNDSPARIAGDHRFIDITALMAIIDEAIRLYGTEPENENEWPEVFWQVRDKHKSVIDNLSKEFVKFFEELKRLQAGVWSCDILERVSNLINRIKSLNDPQRIKSKETLLFNFLATFCLYWSLLKDDQSKDNQRDQGETGKIILHVPYLSYDDRAQGGAIFFLNGTLPPTYKEMELLSRAVESILTRVGTQEAAYYEREITLEMKRARNRAAAAAILTRNMSHNIGSHVTPRTKLNDLKRRVRKMFIQDEWWDGGDWNTKAYPMLEELKDKLDEYIQRKAEFIAEFSTNPLVSTRGAWFYKDVIQPLIANTALMDTLAANEGFTYKNFCTPRLIIRCFRVLPDEKREEFKVEYCSDWISDKELSWPKGVDGAPYAMRHVNFASQELYAKTLNDVSDVRVAVPGSVGEMAIYSILENIIRNAAKHGTKNRGPSEDRVPLVINILIKEGEFTEETCHVTVWDSLSDPGKEIKSKPLYMRIEKLVKQCIIDNVTGELRKEAWGIADMVLCANLLKQHTPDEMPVPPCLEVLTIDESENSNGKCLAYRFQIPKARRALLFGWESDDRVKVQEDKLASLGVVLHSIKDLTAHAADPLPSCDFAVINGEDLAPQALKKIYEQRYRVPFRIIFVGTRETDDTDTNVTTWLNNKVAHAKALPEWTNTDSVAIWLWETWIEYLRKNKPVGADVYLQQANTDSPTDKWIIAADKHNGKIAKGFTKNLVPLRVWANDLDTKNSVKCFTKAKGIHPGEQRVVVDRHGIMVQETGVGSLEHDKVIIIDKSSMDFGALFNPSLAMPWTMPYELAEAGLLRVLVIDERIVQRITRIFDEPGAGKDAFREAFTGDTKQAATAWHVARKAGVDVITHLALNPPSQDKSSIFAIASQKWIGDLPDSSSPSMKVEINFSIGEDLLVVKEVRFSDQYNDAINPDLVIVHQGVADHLNDKVANLGKGFLEAISRECWLIVESGRGIPPEVETSNHKFLTFSAIERAFHNSRMAKLALTRMAMSATRHKKLEV